MPDRVTTGIYTFFLERAYEVSDISGTNIVLVDSRSGWLWVAE
jgi:hypothetical protein